MPRVAFIGGGNMARSLIGGLLARGVGTASLCVSEPNAELRAALTADFGVTTTADNRLAVDGAAAVLLAVKPQVMRAVCTDLAAGLAADCVLVSIAAGIGSGQIERWASAPRAVVRAMPNTPALLGCGASGLYANAQCTGEQRRLAEQLLAAVGMTVWIDNERQMDVVTALSGSGPAYAFLLAEAMQAAAERLGLPATAAQQLTAQTLLGAARMLLESGESAEQLRRRVTSPGGTTQAAIEHFQQADLAGIVAGAISAAARRGAELAAAAGD